jgi:hypothetical protein
MGDWKASDWCEGGVTWVDMLTHSFEGFSWACEMGESVVGASNGVPGEAPCIPVGTWRASSSRLGSASVGIRWARP